MIIFLTQYPPFLDYIIYELDYNSTNVSYKINRNNNKIKKYLYNLTSIVFFPIFGEFTWKVSDCEELEGVTHRR